MTGHAGNGKVTPEPNPHAIAQSAILAIEKPVHDTLAILLRGIIVTCPGYPLEIVLGLVAYHMGNLMGASVNCELTQHFALRKKLREAFEEGLKQAPMNPPPNQQAPANLKG